MRISDWSSDVCSSDLQTASTQAALEAKIEIRGDDPDHDFRPVDTETLKQHTAQAQDARQRWNDLGNAHHRQRVDRGDRPTTRRFHLRAGNTRERTKERREGRECVKTSK